MQKRIKKLLIINYPLLIKLSWKNIWRNKVRSGVILGAIAIGLFSGTYIVAFLSGWIIGTVKDDINTNLSHIQIHDATFSENHEISKYFLQPDIEDDLQKATNGQKINVSERLVLSGMLSSANNAVGMKLKAVDPEQEKTVSTIWETIPDSLGNFLPDDAKMPIVISKKTAEKLKVKLKSKIVFTFQDAAEEMQTIAFRIGGIYKTANSDFDENTVFVRYDDIFSSTALPEGAIHEAAILLDDNSTQALENCDLIAPNIKEALPDFSVQTWEDMNPTIAMTMEWIDFYTVIILGIFFLALSFGIINTMLMAVLERTKELGMLGAIGMSKAKIFKMIILETVFLTFLGSVVGVILATIVLSFSLKTGIDLSFMMGDSFEDYGFSSIVYPVINSTMFLEIVVLVLVAGVLSAIYPAVKALKIKPLEAMK